MRQIITLGTSLILFIICFSTYNLSAQDKHIERYTDIGVKMPELKVRNYFGVAYSELDIIEDKNYVIFLFNPSCYHCVEMTDMLLKHADELSETTILFIATQDALEMLPQFMRDVNYKESPNLIIGVDDSDIVRKLYNSGMLPQLMFYNSQHQLIKIYNGDMTWEEFSQHL